MPERIKLLLKSLGLSQTDFGKKINVSAAFVSQLTKGQSSPSDRTIADICRTFYVSEEWLRTGAGEMFENRSRNERLADFFADVLDHDDFRRDFISRLECLTLEDWEAVQKIIEKMLGKKGAE